MAHDISRRLEEDKFILTRLPSAGARLRCYRLMWNTDKQSVETSPAAQPYQVVMFCPTLNLAQGLAPLSSRVYQFWHGYCDDNIILRIFLLTKMPCQWTLGLGLENESPQIELFQSEPFSSHHIMTIYSSTPHRMKPWFCGKDLKLHYYFII